MKRAIIPDVWKLRGRPMLASGVRPQPGGLREADEDVLEDKR